LKERGNADLKTLADLMENPKFNGIIGAVDQIVDGGLGHTAFGGELILRHISLGQEFLLAKTDGLIQLHETTTLKDWIFVLYGQQVKE
jgi:hypothetical protein